MLKKQLKHEHSEKKLEDKHTHLFECILPRKKPKHEKDENRNKPAEVSKKHIDIPLSPPTPRQPLSKLAARLSDAKLKGNGNETKASEQNSATTLWSLAVQLDTRAKGDKHKEKTDSTSSSDTEAHHEEPITKNPLQRRAEIEQMIRNEVMAVVS